MTLLQQEFNHTGLEGSLITYYWDYWGNIIIGDVLLGGSWNDQNVVGLFSLNAREVSNYISMHIGSLI